MSPCLHGMAYPQPPLSASLSLLSCSQSAQLADFCALLVPCIWADSFKQPVLNAKRYATFKIFCQKILKATQISCACVLLALYYIHRLHSAYPSIRASIGSEARLFTTALILANKFLDDNTFTNKTWSDVSNIPVRELNIMEMEFLSALNYNIYLDHTRFFAWVTQCHHQWLPLQQQQQRVIHNAKPATSLAPVMPRIKSSASVPSMMLPSLKRMAPLPYQPHPSKRRIHHQQHHHHVPYTPPVLPSQQPMVVYHHHQPTPTATTTICSSSSSSSSSSTTPPPYSHFTTNSTIYTLPTPPQVVSSSCISTIPPVATTTSSSSCCAPLCQPILSWSSSSSALKSSRHSTTALLQQSSSSNNTSYLTSRIRCLEIE